MNLLSVENVTSHFVAQRPINKITRSGTATPSLRNNDSIYQRQSASPKQQKPNRMRADDSDEILEELLSEKELAENED
jgi:hypothetical protein